MTQLSIVIPMSDAAAQFEATLASVLGNRPADCEIIVVTAGQYDDPYDLADEVQFVEADIDSGLLDLINAGFRRARGEVSHLLLCGVEVEEGWTTPAVQQFQDPSVGSVSPLILSPQDAQCVAAAGVQTGLAHTKRLASAGKRLPHGRSLKARISGPTLTCGFYRNTALARLCGMDTEAGETLADLDLGLSLAELGYVARFEPTSRVRGQVLIPNNAGFRKAQLCERLFWKHYGSLTSLAGHATAVVFEFLRNLTRGRAVSTLAGRLWGVLHAPFDHGRSRSAPWPSHELTGGTTRADPPHSPQRINTKRSRRPLKHPTA